MSDTMICGRAYTIQSAKAGVKPRITVDGVTHIGGTEKHPNNGKLIRFKSLDRAERHIVNMRLQK